MLGLTAFIALVSPEEAGAAPPGRLGLVLTGEMTPHHAAILDWARRDCDASIIRADGDGGFLNEDERPVELGSFSCLWYHSTFGAYRQLSAWECPLTTEASLRALADYLACGGGLYVTGSGARLLNYLGVEPYFASMGYVTGGNDDDCGYEVLQPEHPIFAGLDPTFMVQHMDREESGGVGYWTPEKLQSPLAYSYFCTAEQKERFLAGTPLARWARLEEDRTIIVEHQVGEGKVITNGPYFYYFDDAADPYRANLERLTRNTLAHLWHDGPVPVEPATWPALTLMRRTGTWWGLGLSPEQYEAIDLLDYYFDISLLTSRSGYGTDPWPPSARLAKTIGVEGERGKGHIAGDIRHNPVVSMYAYAECKSLFPNNSNHGVLDAWCKDAILTRTPEVMERLRECIEFVLWAQYDENGYNAFLDETGQMEFDGKTGDPDWAYGWPYMNFDWPDSIGYEWKAFESFHHTTPAYPLVKAYEITGDRRCLEATRNWLLHQLPRYGPNGGVYEVEWQGKPAYWTGYNPMPPVGGPDDAVDNIQTLLAEPLAAVGYHTKDDWMLERARGLLWYACRELAVDGEWYYYSIDSARYGEHIRSHMSAVVEPGMNAIAYLDAAGIDCSDIKKHFLPGVVLQRSWAAPGLWNFTYSLAKFLPEEPLPRDASANGREVEFLDYIKVHHADLKEVTLRDTLPAGFAVPDELKLTIDGPDGRRQVAATPGELAGGVLVSNDCRPGDVFAVRYVLNVDDVGKIAETPAPEIVMRGVETMRGPDTWIEQTGEAQYVADVFEAHPINIGNYQDRRLYGGPLPRDP